MWLVGYGPTMQRLEIAQNGARWSETKKSFALVEIEVVVKWSQYVLRNKTEVVNDASSSDFFIFIF